MYAILTAAKAPFHNVRLAVELLSHPSFSVAVNAHLQESVRVQVEIAAGVRLLLRQALDSSLDQLLQRVCIEQQLNVALYVLVA